MVGRLKELVDGSKRSRVRDQALAALRTSDMSGVLEAVGITDGHEATGAALKAILAERLVECTLGGLAEARKRGVRMGAATVIIASKA